MAKFSLSLIAFVLAVLVDVSMSGLAGRPGPSGQDRVSGGPECSQMKAFLPKPMSGCCGRHAGVEQWYQDANKKKKHFKRSIEENASHIAPDKYITGGEATGIAQYPWLVRVTVYKHTEKREVCYDRIGGLPYCQVQDVTIYSTCGGSLVSSRHVLTAAHCLDKPNVINDDVAITMAEYNTITNPDCVGSKCVPNLVMHPDEIYIHSGYEFRSDTYFDDIAMLRLDYTAPYTDYIRPICLPSFNINKRHYEGLRLTTTGWGQTGETKRPSPVKMLAHVRVVAPETCKQYYPLLTESMLCAASTTGDDVCRGDSGGPIMVEKEGVFYLVGIVSAKRGECGSPVPTKYTNVFSYSEWIQNIIEA